MFSYFLVASGVLANAYALLLQEEHWGASLVAASIGCLVGLVSFGLDVRNRQLVKLGEDVLSEIERGYLFPAGQKPSAPTLRRPASSIAKLWVENPGFC